MWMSEIDILDNIVAQFRGYSLLDIFHRKYAHNWSAENSHCLRKGHDKYYTGTNPLQRVHMANIDVIFCECMQGTISFNFQS
eukprot:m.266401 g.266401  ORF g.266401 m.266401 type:complete len:82 (-) comp16239_c0_seq42:111-356(-)